MRAVTSAVSHAHARLIYVNVLVVAIRKLLLPRGSSLEVVTCAADSCERYC
jgi:hypothetical protein